MLRQLGVIVMKGVHPVQLLENASQYFISFNETLRQRIEDKRALNQYLDTTPMTGENNQI